MYYDYNGNEIEDLEMDNMRRDSREEQRQEKLTVTFDEARAFLYISDNFGGNIDLNPKQAMELLDFLLQKAEDIRGYVTPGVDKDGLDQLGQHLWNEVAALERLDQHLDGDREVEEDD